MVCTYAYYSQTLFVKELPRTFKHTYTRHFSLLWFAPTLFNLHFGWRFLDSRLLKVIEKYRFYLFSLHYVDGPHRQFVNKILISQQLVTQLNYLQIVLLNLSETALYLGISVVFYPILAPYQTLEFLKLLNFKQTKKEYFILVGKLLLAPLFIYASWHYRQIAKLFAGFKLTFLR